MNGVINPFKNAGIALLAIGILDVGFMVYCIVNNINYSSSFNIFAVIAGIFLIKRSASTARIVRWLTVFFAIALVCSTLALFFITPFDLQITQLRLNPLPIISQLLLSILVITALVWIHLQLSTPDALNILRQAGYKTDKPKSAYIAGFVLSVLVLVFLAIFMTGESAQKAKALAQKQLGSEYQYYISTMSTSGNSGQASIIAYRKNEIKDIQVKW
jgi:glucan phosphoethanolaminetransferase (alkaline phosphatase superfamily)